MLHRSQALCRHERSAGCASTSAPSAPCRPAQRQRRRAVAQASPELVDALSALVPSLPLEQIAAPCQVMKCGDIVYRSTLDPALYKSGGFDWRTATLLGAVLGYFILPPGVLPGAIDYYVTSALKRKEAKAIDKNDIVMGKRLGTGGFGTVYKGELKEEDGTKTPIIIKKAKEFGEAEVWMNERMSRVPGNHVAEFVTAFDETTTVPTPAAPARRPGAPVDSPPIGALDANAIWLVWFYEGDNTLMAMLEKREFPYNLEPLLFGRELRTPRGAARELVTIREVLRQLLVAVNGCHANGIIHRDIKPANCIISTRDRKLKLIDLGAAADLRIGINYVPNEYLLDPRYAPPQQYIMSTQTPKPPPKPVAAFLSPVLWAMERPDRFDMYSVGVCMLQLLFGHLRNDNALIAFNKRLEELRWDLNAWRAEEQAKLSSGSGLKPAIADSLAAGFSALGAGPGSGWDLLTGLMAYTPSERLSAAQALAHPWLTSSPTTAAALGQGTMLASISTTVTTAAAAASTAVTAAGKTIGRAAAPGLEGMAEAITKTNQGALTEAQLMEELGLMERAPVAPREGSQTIAWWQQRQNDLRERIRERRDKLASQVDSAISNVRGAKGAAEAAAAARPEGSGKVKVPQILGAVLPRKAADAAANGNGNGKAAVGNGKAAAGKAAAANGKAAANGNGKAAANGNGNGNGKAAVGGGSGRLALFGNLANLGGARAASPPPPPPPPPRAAANRNGNGNGKRAPVEEDSDEEEEQLSVKEKVLDIAAGLFRR